MASTRENGANGEETVALRLESSGWRIIKKNFRTRRGEVDIIGDDGQDIVFVEVKTWTSLDQSSLEYAINRRKQSRIIRTAQRFLAENPWFQNRTVRFDVVFLSGETTRMEHIQGAFETEWDA